MDAQVKTTAAPLITIVDDDEAVRDSLQMLLEFHGIEVRSADSASAFWTSFQNHAPDCVILDLHLPDVGGLEILRDLRVQGPQPPVIVITGQGDRATREAALGSGASAYLEKPFTEERLIQAIDDALAGS